MTAREIITRTREAGGYFVLDVDGFRLCNANRLTLATVAQIRAHRDAIKTELESKRSAAR
jgi:hypothetical protein